MSGAPKRGAEFAFEAAATWPAVSVTTVTDTTHYGSAVATAWDRLHALLVRRSVWAEHPKGELPVIEGTVIRLQVDHLRGDRNPKPLWLLVVGHRRHSWGCGPALAGIPAQVRPGTHIQDVQAGREARPGRASQRGPRRQLRAPAAADRWT